ncbi:perilipin-2 [Pimephales promelas]|uniref:perilipin-2 n=1 Tax=Pimephales promelas TaxID=90988 RepID=UPI001955BAEA|nr:perilipin-2 [Pimephales promelas]KAG1951439.1 perilipin-2 [Pimephales promelas]
MNFVQTAQQIFYSDMASVDIVNNQNVVDRIVHLPLVISTYGMVSNVYCNTKNNYPYLKSVCEVAENGVKSITSAAFYSALPIIGKLEPQISMANDLACKGLDKIEKTLPILHKPSDQIVKEAVTGAKEAVSGTMNGAKESLGEVMDRTRGVVHGGVEKTKTVVSGRVQTVMESRAVKLMSNRVDTALSTSETLLEQYLPETEEMKECEGNNSDAPSYYVRLGSLSSKVRDRTYQRAVDKIENTRKSIDVSNQKLHRKLSSLMGWKTGSQSQEENETVTDNEAEQTESHTLTIVYNLSLQLQTTYLVLVSSLKSLPQHAQVQVASVSHSAMEVYSSFSKTAVIEDVSSTILVISRSQLSRIGDSMDNVMDYLLNNTPLNWLVGPFYPRAARSTSNGPKCNKQRTLQPEVEMQSVHEDR